MSLLIKYLLYEAKSNSFYQWSLKENGLHVTPLSFSSAVTDLT